MSTPNQYLVCLDANHAAAVDALVIARLRRLDGNKGSSWSGVFTDGLRFGILWAAPVSAIVADGEVVEEVFDEAGVSNWQPVPPPAEETPL